MYWKSISKRVKVPYTKRYGLCMSKSKAEHEEFCLKEPGPSGKAKY